MPRIQMYVEFMDGPCEGEFSLAVVINQNGFTERWGPDGVMCLYKNEPDTNRFYYKGALRDADGS